MVEGEDISGTSVENQLQLLSGQIDKLGAVVIELRGALSPVSRPVPEERLGETGSESGMTQVAEAIAINRARVAYITRQVVELREALDL